MRTILEALSKWHPPAGSVRSVAVDADETTGDHAATIRLRRSADSMLTIALRLGYADAMNLTVEAIHARLTAAAIEAWVQPAEAEPATPKPHVQPQPKRHAGSA